MQGVFSVQDKKTPDLVWKRRYALTRRKANSEYLVFQPARTLVGVVRELLGWQAITLKVNKNTCNDRIINEVNVFQPHY
jgi:hypothetical protein